MTPFEIIILSIIYMICHGFVSRMLIKKDEDNVLVIFLLTIVSLALAIYYAPIIIGRMLYEKLKEE